MSQLREEWLERGYTNEDIDVNLHYLEKLALYAAIEIDTHLTGVETDFGCLTDIVDIFERYRYSNDLADKFPYDPMRRLVLKVNRPNFLLLGEEMDKVNDLLKGVLKNEYTEDEMLYARNVLHLIHDEYKAEERHAA